MMTSFGGGFDVLTALELSFGLGHRMLDGVELAEEQGRRGSSVFRGNDSGDSAMASRAFGGRGGIVCVSLFRTGERR